MVLIALVCVLVIGAPWLASALGVSWKTAVVILIAPLIVLLGCAGIVIYRKEHADPKP
jgi:biotin transporter BioY